MALFYWIIRKIFVLIFISIVLVIMMSALFITFSPQFGGSHTDERLAEFNQSGHFKDGKFHNEIETKMDFPLLKVAGEFLKLHPNRNPGADVPVLKLSDSFFKASPDYRLTWFGHSAFLLEMEGKKILLDPMFGISPAPHPLIGPKRYSSELPLDIGSMPFIDLVILSHDHYDHLDYGSIQKLKNKVGVFYVPLGVGTHLQAWGIAPEQIKELNWWDETSHDGLRLVCTPARHFSGRGVTDRFKTLWAGWVIAASDYKIFFSGDSGYGPHFKAIGETLGPFDISMMECGQYNVNWSSIHMMPEETVQATLDLKSELLLPIHWGAFTLAFHSWTDPVERALRAAGDLGVPVTTPRIGEPVLLKSADYPQEPWWKAVR